MRLTKESARRPLLSTSSGSERGCHSVDDYLITKTRVDVTAVGRYVLNSLYPGPEYFEYTNNVCWNRRVYLRYWWQLSYDNFQPYGRSHSRVLVIYDRQPADDGSLPVISDVLQTHDENVGGLVTAIWSLQNRDNEDRFLILHDDWLVHPPVLVSGTSSNTPNPAQPFHTTGTLTLVAGNYDVDTEGAWPNGSNSTAFYSQEPLSRDSLYEREVSIDLDGLVTVFGGKDAGFPNPKSGTILLYVWNDLSPADPDEGGPWIFQYASRLWYDTDVTRAAHRGKKLKV